MMVTLAVLMSALAGAGIASADDGHYTIRSCPTGKVGATDLVRGGWMASAFPEAAAPALTTCGADGVFGTDLSKGVPSGSSLAWLFLAPEAVTIDRVRLERRVRLTAGQYYSLQTDKDGLREQAGPADWSAAAYETHGGQWATVTLTCIDVAACAPATGPTVALRGFEADLVDSAPPTIQSYSLGVDAPPPARPATLTLAVVAADKGSGVKSITALLDGQVVAQKTDVDGTCAPPYPVPGPCPLTSTLNVPMPREALERGTGVLELEATDAGGNRTRTAPVPLWTFGFTGSPPAAIRRGVLTVGFKGTSKTSISGRYENPPTVSGTVRDGAGAAMPGVPVRLDTRLLLPDAAFATFKTVATDKNGNFSVRLPSGPSREIQATATVDGAASVGVLRVSVAAPVRLRANRTSTRNHRSVTFTGTVPGTPKGARTRVDLQAFGGGHWLTFASPTLKNGKFSASYRFTRTFSAATYRFRAVLRSDEDFPYAAGRSREVRIRVRP